MDESQCFVKASEPSFLSKRGFSFEVLLDGAAEIVSRRDDFGDFSFGELLDFLELLGLFSFFSLLLFLSGVADILLSVLTTLRRGTRSSSRWKSLTGCPLLETFFWGVEDSSFFVFAFSLAEAANVDEKQS